MADSQKPKIRVSNISCIIPESSSSGGLFVGNIYGAQNPDILKEYGIRSVLTSSLQTPSYDPAVIPFHLKIKALDQDSYSIIDDLKQCLEFIERTRQLTSVLVHCYAGVSRSVSIIIAYLMKIYRWDLETTLSFVKNKRVVAKPNDGFMRQLKQFQQLLKIGSDRKQSIRANQNQNSYSALNTYSIPKQSTTNYSHSYQNRLKSQNITLNSLSNTPKYAPNNPYQFFDNKANKSNNTLKSLSLNRAGTNPPQTELYQASSQEQYHQRTSIFNGKRHSQTPIPKILSRKNTDSHKKQFSSHQLHHRNHTNSTSQQHLYKTFTGTNTNADKMEQEKTTSRLIRPKDLPGYRHH